MVTEEENEELMEEVSIDELQAILGQFKKHKRLGSDGILVEFYIGIFDVVS